jgi:hydroxymethylbilane synthase
MDLPFPDRPFRLGTRSSPLAMRQAEMTRDALCAAHGWPQDAVELVPVVASGDKILDRPLADVGGKALWTRELDAWLAEGRTDASVHSMKDVETIRPTLFVVAAMLPRADGRDRLIGAESIDALPLGATIGTSSPRRSAQLLRLRPDLKLVLLRGNVGTRLGKIAAGEADATLLAAAGLDRLGMHDTGVSVPFDMMLPAPSQGAVGIEVLAENAHARALVSAINHEATCRCVEAERELLAELGADCRSPVAALQRSKAAEQFACAHNCWRWMAARPSKTKC